MDEKAWKLRRNELQLDGHIDHSARSHFVMSDLPVQPGRFALCSSASRISVKIASMAPPETMMVAFHTALRRLLNLDVVSFYNSAKLGVRRTERPILSDCPRRLPSPLPVCDYRRDVGRSAPDEVVVVRVAVLKSNGGTSSRNQMPSVGPPGKSDRRWVGSASTLWVKVTTFC